MLAQQGMKRLELKNQRVASRAGIQTISAERLFSSIDYVSLKNKYGSMESARYRTCSIPKH
jgi:hypothetical protein